MLNKVREYIINNELIKKDDSVKIPVGMHHKWENNSDGEVRIIFAVIL